MAVIERGLLVFIGIEKNDSEREAGRLLERLYSYRVFPDNEGKLNRSLLDIDGGLLLVPQFTLAADTRKGTRPAFSGAADPAIGAQLFTYLYQRACDFARERQLSVASGHFGTDMQVSLVNDGPVTFWLKVPPP